MSRACLKIFSIFILFLWSLTVAAQDKAEEALNTYVEFLNESVHGLTVAHILFVNYNKDLNKYVDLDSHKLNAFMTNQEVGNSIFDNPDISTSDNNTSAIKLSKTVKQLSTVLPRMEANNFNNIVDDIVDILTKINNLRFEIETFINSSDLNEKENIYKSYELLEKAVTYFNDYTAKHTRLVNGLKTAYEYKKEPLSFLLNDIHSVSVNLITDLRSGTPSNLDKYLARILGSVEGLEEYKTNLPANRLREVDDILRQVKGMTSFVTQQIQSPNVPQNYKLYGQYYYMHNHLLLSYFNSISPGFVSKMNTIIEDMDISNLDYDDRPIIYKVTYPEKMVEIEAIVTKKAKPLDIELPVKLKMEIETPQAPQEPQQNFVELEFFDPDLLDRDSISVSWNDEWILENYKLWSEPKKIRLDVDPLAGNSIFIVAKNHGIIAPNTVGFKYRFNGKGKKKEVIRYLEANTGYELILTLPGLGFSEEKIE